MQLDTIRGYLPLTPDILTAGQPSEKHEFASCPIWVTGTSSTWA